MISPRKQDHEDDKELSLSPVLTRKRFSRKHVNRKFYKPSTSPDAKPNIPSPTKSPNSYIPVPVKDYIKNAVHSVNIHHSDEHSTSCSSLTNFKQQVIKNCAISSVLSPNKSPIIVNNQVSISEGSIKNKKSSPKHIFQECSQNKVKCASGGFGDMSEDEFHQFHSKHLLNIPRKVLDMLYENSKFAEGSKTTVESDTSPCLSPSSKESISSPRNISKRPIQTLPQCIKEEDTDKEACSQPNYNDSTDESVAHVPQYQFIPTNNCKNKVKSSFLTKNVFDNSQVDEHIETEKRNFSLSPDLQRVIRTWTEDEKIIANTNPERAQRDVSGNLFGNHSNDYSNHGNAKQRSEIPLLGFSSEEIELIEKKYQRCKEYLNSMGNKKNKLKRPSVKKVVQHTKPTQGNKHVLNENSIMAVSSPVNQTKLKSQNDIVINGVEVEKKDDSIALAANNRVQICIGNNRIQINIKADKKPTSSETSNVPNKQDSQSTGKSIEMPSANSGDIKSHGFWSGSIDDCKHNDKLPNTLNKIEKLVASMRSPCVAKSSASNNSIINGITELSSSGFKSGSGQALCKTEPLEESSKYSGVINKSISFDAACGFQSGGGKPIKLNASLLNKASKMFDDLNGSSTSGSGTTTRGEGLTSTTGSTSPTTRFSADVTNTSSDEYKAFERKASPVKERKILKAKSLLGKHRRENECGGGKENIRKTLFSDNFEGSKNVAEIVQFGNVQTFNFDFNAGFSSASGKKINLSPDKLKKASEKFQDLDFASPKQGNNTNCGGFSSAAGKKIEVDHEKIARATAKYHFLDFESAQQKYGLKVESKYPEMNTSAVQTGSMKNCNAFGGFSSASGKQIEVDAEKLQNATSTYQNLGIDFESPQIQVPPTRNIGGGFSSASGKKITVDPEKIKSFADKFYENSDVPSTSSTKTAPELIQDVVQSYDKALERLNSSKKFTSFDVTKTPVRNDIIESKKENSTPMKQVSTSGLAKKRLGMSRVTNISSIPKEKLEKARLLFDECDKDLTITPMKSFCKTSRVHPYNTPGPAANNYSTPLRNNNFLNEMSTNRGNDKLMTSTPMVQKVSNRNFDLDFTPIKSNGGNKINKRRRKSLNHDNSDDDYDGILLFCEKSKSNFQELQNDIDAEYLRLKRKLEILEERKKALESQRLVVDQCDHEHKRPRLGILSIRKTKQNRVKLLELPGIINQKSDCYTIEFRIQEITPRNAEQIHFLSLVNDKPVVHCLDGAKVIPNTHNTIGLTEINNAFQVMPGIEPNLIPKGWVANHYKWIVWKLACYERRFPDGLKDSLSVDNIMQQLKYRYDREIDRANRPAIRRIMEKDDVANKRMVLCIADIIQICGKKIELILTDGWYPIRTSIDQLLSQQIYKGKLVVGTKLMIQGAEILDCDDGCHPLDAPDHVKLKIGYNNTRRALWHLRLGYYHIPTPFPIHIRSIQPDGGLVACAKVYIVRVYPIRYMEEFKGMKIWRNAKAEDKRSSEFERERIKELEKIKSQVYDEYEASLKMSSIKKLDKNQLKTVTCPKQLYQLIEASNDPESFYSMLSSSQKSSLVEYKLNNASARQKEISDRISKKVEEMKLARRDVTPLLKVLVTDALEDSAKCTVLNVWRPTEDQIQILLEENCISIYNVVMKRTYELSTVRRTMFRLHDGVINKRCQRQLLPISMTTDVYYKPLFNEFDTVGVIVEFTIGDYEQEVWLADFAGRLLYVKIVDGPKVCSLLDTVSIGQSIGLCNLVMHTPHNEFGQALANQYSSLSQFPQQTFLQQGLELFNSQLSDVGKLVNDCKLKIETLRTLVNLKPINNYQDNSVLHTTKPHLFDDSLDEDATIPSRLTMFDVAMSLIDTDKFV
ncbi:breast cancer type 2 susceptibility protein-like [Atheta coriaria]|uniref:breast cancer type 2 susceptibility protein-like n=1 Tax=Dalotia coriaria TaxID=877792 RepID=UPI0031F3E39A